MKFCSKCGHELMDEAVVCTNCGCAVNSPTIQSSPITPSAPSSEKPSVLLAVFNLFFVLSAAVAVFFLFLSVAFKFLDLDSSSVYLDIKGTYYYYIDHHDHSIYGSSYNNFGWALMGFLTSIVSFGSSLTAFIIALVKRVKITKIFKTIAQLVIAILLIILSLIIMGKAW